MGSLKATIVATRQAAMMKDDLVINRRIRILRAELKFTFVRSSGPGGQNVNKVSSKAVLRWKVVATKSLPAYVRERFLTKYARRINEEGELLLTSQRYRDQPRNITDCLEKLQAMVVAVTTVPKQRKATRPSQGAVERRLKAKRETSRRKKIRRTRPTDEE